MNKQIVFFIEFLLLICSYFSLNAQKIVKLKYGNVTLEELQMTKYDKDTSAKAIMLYQYAEFIPTRFQFYNHYKVKILNKNGTNEGNMVFWGNIKQYIKGCTYNLDNGVIVKSTLDKESIFEERVIGNFYLTRVAMPNVKEGSVFEIKILRDGIPNGYEFQHNIPVVYGALLFPSHPDFDIRVKKVGYLDCSYKSNDTWIVKDMPAFVNEPFITSDKDYKVRMEFELIKVNIIRRTFSYFNIFTSTWKAVSEKFNENEYFGKALGNPFLYLNTLTDSIKRISKNDEDLAKNAFETIKKIKWNNEKSCYVSQMLKKTYLLKKGNSADINLNLLMLLKKVGLKSYPVLFSTRDNGRISKYSPSIDKFNYVIIAVDLPSGTKYLDATDEFLPFGLTPERVSCCLGHPLEEGKGDCSVFIEPTKKQKASSYSQFSIDSDGNVAGKITIKRYDYNAIDFKNYLKSLPDHNTYIKEIEAINSGWLVDSYKFNNLNDPYQVFADEYNISYTSTIGTNDMIILNPFAFITKKEHPFQKDVRYLPVSFPVQTEYSSVITYNFPANYQISELPKGIDITNNDKSIRFTYVIQSINNTISISTKFLINKLEFATIEYPELRSIFEMMFQKQNESIVLKKIVL